MTDDRLDPQGLGGALLHSWWLQACRFPAFHGAEQEGRGRGHPMLRPDLV